ncbi:hypothetical protein GIB67_024676 [Kingdonia uniflora]|uniref:TLDc domain-containing protein n=1 Tax=Kingdonia uniflora TaxID=39325 RepID=A0A7J7LPG3_9MAGN|nr:hypothetical protein GIB67_024676 [Kingdonia uniflora]
MIALKDKVADKLSRFLTDPQSSPTHVQSPLIVPESKTRTSPMEEKYGSEKSLSSVLFSYLPTASFGGHKTNKHQHDITPIRSHPTRWKSKSFIWRKRSHDSNSTCDNEVTLPTCKENEGEDSILERNVTSSDKCEGVSVASIPVEIDPDFSEQSSFTSPDLFEFLQSSLPNIVKGCQWVLLYSTLRHGISLRTLLRKSIDLPGPCLLIAGDMQGAVFGGLLECPLRPTPRRKYQGSNQSFVFTTIYGQPRLFWATGANRYYYLCLNDLLALGGGGHFALCLDGDLLRGTSGPCDTFGNLCLAHDSEFELKNVELWGFTHSSRYLT